MPRKGQRKCAGCGEWIDTQDDSTMIRGSRAGKLFCEGCYESGEEHASTVVEIVPRTEADDEDNETLYNDIIVTHFDEDFTYIVTCNGEYADAYEDDPLPEPVKSQTWKHTGGYHGYTAFEFLDGFEVVMDGWVTGWPDETTKRKADIGQLFEDIKSGELPCPVRLFWVFGTTSNIFSIATDIVVASADRKQLEEWLVYVGNDVETLKYQLG